MHRSALLARVGCLTLMVWHALGGQDVPVTTLQQIGSFTLPSNPSRIARATSGGGVLWFSMANGGWNELLATDVAGGNPNQFALQPSAKRTPSSVNAICASTDGRIAVARGDGTVEIYSRSGDLIEAIRFEQQGSTCVFHEDLWVWSRTAMDAVKGPLAGLHIAFPELPDYAHVDLLEFADHRVGLIESSDGVLYLPGQQIGNWLRHPLAAPEFEAIRNFPARENGSFRSS